MPRLSEIFEELKLLSDHISTQVRTVALGILAFVWILLVGEDSTGLTLTDGQSLHLILIGAMSVATLAADFLQYFSGYLATNALRKDMEKREVSEEDYDYTDLRYRARTFLFWAKQVILLTALVWLGVVVGVALVRTLTS